MNVTLSVREELNFVAGERISLSRIGQIEISTVRLPCCDRRYTPEAPAALTVGTAEETTPPVYLLVIC